ncbi:hypothetical protein R0J91_17275, partial [Micrococcus sp. SIMBA_131]
KRAVNAQRVNVRFAFVYKNMNVGAWSINVIRVTVKDIQSSVAARTCTKINVKKDPSTAQRKSKGWISAGKRKQ